jgi:hypothetical protein
MNSTMALARAEVRRLGRNKQYSIFSIALPVVLYLVVSPQTGTPPRTAWATPPIT